MASTTASRAPPLGSSSNRSTPSNVVRIVFFALVLDLLAFTMPLPLFPKIIDDFVQHEASAVPTFGSNSRATFLSKTLSTVRRLRSYLLSSSDVTSSTPAIPSNFDLTLLGGLLGSLFSFCQFLISPQIGKWSDRVGRKPVLLVSMVGNLFSAALWLVSASFGTYACSRIVGGLSEGNVQLSIACISDVTTPSARSRSLALVGIAFSLAFILGPSLGAYFASTDLFRLGTDRTIQVPAWAWPFGTRTPAGQRELRLNSYAVPAAITLALLAVETLFLTLCLPETKGWVKQAEATPGESEGHKKDDREKKEAGEVQARRSVQERRNRLARFGWVHFAFLFFFSGAEVTITFLTHNFFDYSNAQNGRLLGFIGILSSLVQGGYVRRASSTRGRTFALAVSGVRICGVSLFLLSCVPGYSRDEPDSVGPLVCLYLGCAGFAYVSATVVNSLNALASLETDSDPISPTTTTTTTDAPRSSSDEVIEKGQALGAFRSKGQLGRALGPLFVTALYWCASPGVAYGTCTAGMVAIATYMLSWKNGEEREEGRARASRKVE
ncbi:hypothetical protein JCM10212_000624 [Sporobolomyces blumeae]